MLIIIQAHSKHGQRQLAASVKVVPIVLFEYVDSWQSSPPGSDSHRLFKVLSVELGSRRSVDWNDARIAMTE